MTAHDDAEPIVLGIDGSTTSIDAALWAVDEALHRGAPLRLVSATAVMVSRVSEPSLSPELVYAQTALRTASAAITATGKPVTLQTSVAWGPPAIALIAESH